MTVIRLYHDLTQLMAHRGFQLWASNSEEVIKEIPDYQRSMETKIEFKDGKQFQRALGISWNPRSDTPHFKFAEHELKSGTKREPVYLRSWPKAWKSGEWVPVYKKGNKSDVKNYRPVTVLDSVGKVFEQSICKQIGQHYDTVLSPYSTAHRNTHSCETTMIRLVEDWKLSLDWNLSVGILSTDLSKAYDCSQHTLVLRKLQGYGFDYMAIHILRSYFKERLNRVRLGWFG